MKLTHIFFITMLISLFPAAALAGDLILRNKSGRNLECVISVNPKKGIGNLYRMIYPNKSIKMRIEHIPNADDFNALGLNCTDRSSGDSYFTNINSSSNFFSVYSSIASYDNGVAARVYYPPTEAPKEEYYVTIIGNNSKCGGMLLKYLVANQHGPRMVSPTQEQFKLIYFD